MAFLDELGKKLSSAGQTAVSKTKNFAEITKLNSNISDEERRITDNYTEIGKKYVELYKDELGDAFKANYDAILKSQAKIKDYEAQKVQIKGVEKCPKCGAEVDKGATFCPTCGASMKED